MSYLIAIILIPIVLLVGSVLDADTRSSVRETLTERATQLPGQLQRAADTALARIPSLSELSTKAARKIGAYILRTYAEKLGTE